jgi:hypothetical protein
LVRNIGPGSRTHRRLIGSGMHDIAHAGRRARNRIRVADVAVDDLDLEPRQIGPRARGAHEHRTGSGTDERTDNSRSDETRRARHQHASDGHGITGCSGRFVADGVAFSLSTTKTNIKSAFRLRG